MSLLTRIKNATQVLRGTYPRPLKVYNFSNEPLPIEEDRWATEDEIYDVEMAVPVRHVAAMFQQYGWYVDSGRGLRLPDEFDIFGLFAAYADSLKGARPPAYARGARLMVQQDDEPGAPLDLYLYVGCMTPADDSESDINMTDFTE